MKQVYFENWVFKYVSTYAYFSGFSKSESKIKSQILYKIQDKRLTF